MKEVKYVTAESIHNGGLGGYIGMESLLNLTKILNEEQNIHGDCKHVVVDFTGLSLSDGFNDELGNIVYTYQCKIEGLPTKMEDIDYKLSTGFYIKKNLGEEEYSKILLKLIQETDYPLMVKDDRGTAPSEKKYVGVDFYIIQPLGVDNQNLYYKELKPNYTDPITLSTALDRGENVWVSTSIAISDIGLQEVGIRFARNKQERVIMDMLKSIFERRLVGFKGETH